MFEESVLPDSHSKRPSWFIAAISAEPLFVAVAIAVPLLTIPRLAPPRLPTALHFMRQITAVKLIRADAVHIPVAGKTPLPISPRVLIAPSRIPHHVAPAVDVPSALDYVVVPGTGNSPEGVWDAVEGSTNVPGPPPPAFAPRAHATPPAPVRVSRGVQEAKLINKVVPQYPRLALPNPAVWDSSVSSRLSERTAASEKFQVISGPNFLVSAAVEAVKQWIYRPTLLNGESVEVIAPVDINILLNR